MMPRVPLTTLLNDAHVVPGLHDGIVVTEVVAGLKVMDAEGVTYWVTRSTEGVTLVEELGALTLMLTLSKRDAGERYGDSDEVDDAS